MYTISGVDTEQTPATVEFKVVAEAYTDTDITPASNCTPYLIAAYNSHLEIKAGRVISLIP
jgi:predicted aconitase